MNTVKLVHLSTSASGVKCGEKRPPFGVPLDEKTVDLAKVTCLKCRPVSLFRAATT